MRHPPAPAAPLVSLHGQATLSMPREAPLGTCECCPRCPPSRPPAWAAKTRSRRVRRPSVEIREVGSEEGGRPLVTLGLGCGVGGTGTSDAVIYSFAASLAPCLPPSLPPSLSRTISLSLSPSLLTHLSPSPSPLSPSPSLAAAAGGAGPRDAVDPGDQGVRDRLRLPRHAPARLRPQRHVQDPGETSGLLIILLQCSSVLV